MIIFIRQSGRLSFNVLLLAVFSAVSIARAADDIPDSFRKEAVETADQEVKDSAVSPVQVDAAKQPGYVRGTSAASGSYSGTWDNYSTFQFEETRAQLGLGNAWLASSAAPLSEVAISARYRISPALWPISDDTPWHVGPVPLSLSIEAGGIPGGAAIKNLALAPNADTTLNATLRFNYHLYTALVDELPHGRQSWVIPEIAAGIGYTETTLNYFQQRAVPFQDPEFLETSVASDSTYGSKNRGALAPYISGGLHFFADRFVSLLLNASYIKFAYDNSFAAAPATVMTDGASVVLPGYSQTLDFPTHAWAVQARLQIKLAWPTLVHTPMLPQLMPPWLLGAYSTEEISPWVASPQTQQKFNEPGKPPVGNVFFQYKNRSAKRVDLIADFNDWTPEPMIRDRSGMWVTVKDLPAGKFRYNYVVDGREILDPWNKNADTESRSRGSSLVKVLLPDPTR